MTNGISRIKNREHAVVQSLDSLRYKPEGCGFDSPIFPCCDLGVDLASNRNEYQEYFLGGRRWPVRRAYNLATFMCGNLGASTSWNP
jgi:hypothetical protein